MNYRNNSSGTGNQHYNGHGGYRAGEGPPHKSMGAKSGGFNFGANLPSMPPMTPPPPGQDILPVVLPEKAADLVDSTTPAKTGFSLASLGEIKGYLDRLGGIDGILSTVTKVQKVMSSVSQMAPLVKVLMGSFKKSSSDSDDDDGEWKPKRRKRRKPRTGTGSGKSQVRRRTTKRKK
ncbi:hypothetical protein FHS15_003133 [Paenibacillus castaneae]|uniref:tyrosine protein kinase n=1 Tax=Paenibacillus castaneae TaxID=474957 RepID=UPI000C9CB247|nr:tyrosine protein kinase [Paenibacillus castaneae]NIK77995.1 hypothetical protein [Paenibacillus castaneae]